VSFHPVERVLGNLGDFALAGRAVERVALGADELERRILRLESSAGDLGIRLTDDARLRDGDVLYADDRCVIAVAVVPDDVLVVRPRTRGEALAVAHAIGNRHAPLTVAGDEAIVRATPALEALLTELAVPFERRLR
jgi:urease accessory protein